MVKILKRCNGNVKVVINLKHLRFFSERTFRQMEAQKSESPTFQSDISHPHYKVRMSGFAMGGPQGTKFNNPSHLGPFLRISISKIKYR